MVTTIIAIFVERKLARVLKIAKNRLHANLFLFHHFCEFLHNEKMLTPPTNALYHYPNGMGTFLQMQVQTAEVVHLEMITQIKEHLNGKEIGTLQMKIFDNLNILTGNP